ncbi:4-alpha-glucanotransferase [Phycicoccus endophyticus]|uniref:4-alpha-glucanotransferase n=1 Tax=Phycicoccus endophyticus TaxID=1690220 RepID=A0A7G9QZ19_9MICO|nr:4-alpha-glucanotransferase [Phycicoccus endophyticus]NHI18935.1 4-alpha-glucanotransferase [Phycicoccus endophyticus]QNN48594.1 4-alpha-glucanotransferase [Phycicoccus endophyticus]GGL31520.1 4-alpha-glucanotransferase [Phycicoccus endophyticus]
MEPAPTPLVELAQAHHVATDYWDWQGRHVTVSDASIRAVLAALGVPAEDDAAVAASLREHAEAPWRHTLAPTVVARAGRSLLVPAHVPAGSGIRLHVELEDGGRRELAQVDRWVPDREVAGRAVGEATFEVPADLPLGWHRLVADVDATPLEPATLTSTLVVTPERLQLPEPLGSRRAVGLMAQLYQVRSGSTWGVGDLRDLAGLATWAAAAHDADFVLVNPLHAAEPVPPMEASPYLPTTRRFVNPLYLHVEDVPEVAALDASAHRAFLRLADRGRALSAGERIDRDAAWALKREALRLVFDAGLTGTRAEAFAAYCTREGEGLARFATWCALADVHGLPFTTWPAQLQDPDGPAVGAFREQHADDVDFHRWMQWLLEEQLAGVQREARAAGMALGVVHDLAVGVHPVGADAWGLGGVLAHHVTVGAPPDQFNQLGQNWSQPPWRPDRLAEVGYAPFRDMVRTVLRDSGGIRVDHILGLFRLWWIPEGGSPAEGTYVYYDHEALVGILVLEAQRAGAVVIGEDLGVVAPNVRDVLDERGLLGTSVLWFEWEEDVVRAPESYRDLCLSTVTVHDLPPTAGYLTLEHVAVRERLGLLTRPVAEERALEENAIERVRAALAERGLLAADADVDDTVVALHRWLADTPSRMLAVSLPDVVGDRRAINQPGTNDEYPNWRLPLSGPDGEPVDLEAIRAAPLAERLFDALRGRVSGEAC